MACLREGLGRGSGRSWGMVKEGVGAWLEEELEAWIGEEMRHD